MREIPTGLAARLAAGVTTLATCWRLTRTDGVEMGFTDHDDDIVIGGTVFAAATGLTRSAASAASGLAVGEEEIAGVIDAAALTEEDLLAGRWDGARVEVILVDWQVPDDRLVLKVATIGEVIRADGGFRAELRGPAHRLERVSGRIYGRLCDAEFGDGRCGVDATSPIHRAEATVTGGDGRSSLLVDGIATFADGWFTGGRLTISDGALAGHTIGIDAHEAAVEAGAGAGAARLRLWRRLPLEVAAGTGVVVVAGCDKRLATCREKFANTVNFRGFPHIPGNDFAFSYARTGGANDGGVLFE